MDFSTLSCLIIGALTIGLAVILIAVMADSRKVYWENEKLKARNAYLERTLDATKVNPNAVN